MSVNEYITVEEAGDILQLGPRMVNNYGKQPDARLRTQRVGRRVLYHKGDVEKLAEELNVLHNKRPRKPKTDLIPVSDMMRYIEQRDERLAQLQDRLERAMLEIGVLRGQLETRLLPEDAESLRQQVNELQQAQEEWEAERMKLQEELEQRSKPWWKRIFGNS